MGQPPGSPEEQLAWLVDRAAISDLLYEQARCLDAKEFDALQSLFVDDGYLQLPGVRIEARDLARAALADLGGFQATCHLSTNHAISIDGDTAAARSYFAAIHVAAGSDQFAHSDIGGWYDSRLVRSDGRWRIASIEETFVWRAGDPVPAT